MVLQAREGQPGRLASVAATEQREQTEQPVPPAISAQSLSARFRLGLQLWQEQAVGQQRAGVLPKAAVWVLRPAQERALLGT